MFKVLWNVLKRIIKLRFGTLQQALHCKRLTNPNVKRSAGTATLLLLHPRSCSDVQDAGLPGTVGRFARGETGAGTRTGVRRKRGGGKQNMA
jgi:hypothetical protein